MANVEIELNSSGIVSLLKSSEIASACEKEARKMTLATGMQYQADVYSGRNRVNAAGYEEKGE